MRRPLFIVVMVGIFFLFSCGTKENQSKVNKGKVFTHLEVKVLTYKEVPEEYFAPGTVVPQNGARISAKVMGRVLKIYVKEGDKIEKGTPLLKIEDRVYRAKLLQARAALSEAKEALKAMEMQVQEARSAFDLAKKTYERFLRLRKKGVISEQRFDEVEARFKQASAAYLSARKQVGVTRAAVERARGALEEARVFLGYTKVTAPFSGRITKKMVEEGDTVAVGAPLFLMEYNGLYEVASQVPSSYLRWIRIGSRVKVVVGERSYEGRVETVVLQGNPTARSYTVKVSLPKDDYLKPGMFACVHFPLFQEKRLLIPVSALVSFGQIKGVYTVNDSGRITFRIIRVGRSMGNFYEVLSGLKQGDRYLVNPSPDVSDGDWVKGV